MRRRRLGLLAVATARLQEAVMAELEAAAMAEAEDVARVAEALDSMRTHRPGGEWRVGRAFGPTSSLSSSWGVIPALWLPPRTLLCVAEWSCVFYGCITRVRDSEVWRVGARHVSRV